MAAPRFLLVTLVGIAVALVSAPAASAAAVDLTYVDSGDFLLECGKSSAVRLRLPDAPVVDVAPVTPLVEQPVYGEGQVIGWITAINVDAGAGVVQFVAVGSGAVCGPVELQPLGLSDEMRFQVRYRAPQRQRALRPCGTVWMYYTRADVEATGYVPCRVARRVAATWRKRSACGMRCWKTRRTVGRYRCVLGGVQVVRVSCRSGSVRRIVWSWGD